jgi:hypothetical protein
LATSRAGNGNPPTVGGAVGAAIGAVGSAIVEVVARLHGVDPGSTVDPAVVVAVSGAGAFVGDKIAKGLSIRRQLRHLRARAELIENGSVRAFVLERLKSTEADWRAGVLSDIAIREVVIDEIYKRYVAPATALAARKQAAVSEASEV